MISHLLSGSAGDNYGDNGLPFPPRAFIRAHRIVKSDGTAWDREVLLEEFKRQLEDAADGACPDCADLSY